MPISQSIKQGVRIVFVRPITQPLFELLHAFSVRMMNYGNALFENTGEIQAFERIVKQYLKNAKNKTLAQSDSRFTCIDVGANKGNYAASCLNIIEQNFTGSMAYSWISFEPTPATFDLCRKTLTPYPQAQVVQKALSDSEGFARFRMSHAEFLGTNGLLSDSETLTAVSDASEITVETMTLDHYLAQNSMNHIDFLKIDAEGFDINVIRGAKDAIERGMINVLQFEYGYAGQSHFLKEYFDILAPLYDMYRILPRGLRKVRKYSLDLEIPHGMNYLCILKK